jgi:hypothetical protein
VEISGLAGPDEDGVYTYTATYKTSDYGDFTNDYKLTVRPDIEGERQGAVGLFADIPRDGRGEHRARGDAEGCPRRDIRVRTVR